MPVSVYNLEPGEVEYMSTVILGEKTQKTLVFCNVLKKNVN